MNKGDRVRFKPALRSDAASSAWATVIRIDGDGWVVVEWDTPDIYGGDTGTYRPDDLVGKPALEQLAEVVDD